MSESHFEQWPQGLPQAQGLYDPRNEHDAWAIGLVANIKKAELRDIVPKGIQVLINLTHSRRVWMRPEDGRRRRLLNYNYGESGHRSEEPAREVASHSRSEAPGVLSPLQRSRPSRR